MSFQILPAEVIENIFQFLDGQTFCTARQVCKIWNDLIKTMQKRKNHWKEICIREISKNVLQEVLWYKSIPDIDLDWINFYKMWFCSRIIGNARFWKRKIHAFHNNPITCMGISGSYVISGHSNGLVCIWNLYTGDLQQNLLCHLKCVTDLALIDLLNLGSYYGLEELPWSHHHLITISKDHYIRVMPLLDSMDYSGSDLINYHTDDLKQIKVFGDIFAVSCRDNTVSLWKMKVVHKPHVHLKVTKIKHIVGPPDTLFSMGFWNDELHCISYSGKLRSIHLSSNESDWDETPYFRKYYVEKCGGIVSVMSAFVFRDKTVILLTSEGRMVVSVNVKSFRIYHLMKTLRTSVVTVAFHASILALGGENGKLFLFYVPSEEGLAELDLSKPDFDAYLSEASITSISILCDSDSPIVAASTTESIVIFKWYRQNNRYQVLQTKTKIENIMLR